MSNVSFLITGSTSKTGIDFLKILSKKNFKKKIYLIIRKNSDKKKFKSLKLNILFIIEDLKKLKKKKIYFEEELICFHIAGINTSLDILNFCIKNYIKKIVSIHTTGMFSKYKPETKDYIKIDHLFKKKCSLFKIKYCLIYPTLIYGTEDDGNISKLIIFIKNKLFFPIFGKGHNLFQPVYYKDLSKAFYQIFKNQKKCIKNNNYILSGKHPIKYISMLSLIKSEINSKIFFIKIPVKISVYILNLLKFFNKRLPINKYLILRMQENRSFSHKKASMDFGYNPISFNNGIRKQIKKYFNL